MIPTTIETFLFQYINAKREVEMLDRKMDMIRQEMFPKSPSFTGMPGGSRQTDRMADYMIKYDEIQRTNIAARRRAINMMELVDETIQKVQDPLLKQILTYRYIMGNKWETIADVLGYSTQRIFQMRKRAINEIKCILDDGK